MDKKKIYFFKYDTWQGSYVYLPHIWYEFKRYYELNGKYSERWEWIPPVIDYFEWTVDDIVNDAVSKNADVYMFSSYMWSWEMIKVIANAIKKELPKCIITLGGPHQHTTYTQPILWFKNHPYVDATARPSDYGEFFITDMLDSIIEGNLDWKNVRGSYHRRGYGPEGNKKDFTYPPDIIESNLDHARQVSAHAKEKNKLPAIMYETNRGCMYKCVYCEWGGGTNTKVILKDMESIKNDISYFRELDIHTVWITDANFGMIKRDPEIAQLLADQNDYMRFVGITGLAKTKAEKRAAVLEPLIQAGLVTLYQISLQTIDEQILENIIRTDVTPEENISLAKYLIGKYDIDVIVELILGLPGMKVETFYKEAAIEYSLMNSVKHHTHHVPLYVLPDAPVADPEYLAKYEMKLTPIAIEESAEILKDKNSKYIKLFEEQGFPRENTLHIPISSYSYTVEDWKEMFFMNDMNLVLMNMIMITPFMDFLHYHRGIPLDQIFKKIYESISSVESFYRPILEGYLIPMADGQYWNRSWREFEVGPVKGPWTIHYSYAWLWIDNIDEIYDSVRNNFSQYIDEMADDCLVYCKNSTLSWKEEKVWENKWRWDTWEEKGIKIDIPEKANIMLKTAVTIWENVPMNEIYRNRDTVRYDSGEPIKMKLFQLSRAGNNDE